jgi:STE24 endopeptidase
MNIKKKIILFITLDFSLTLLLRFLSYFGDTADSTKIEVLKYFTEENFLAGIEYSRRGFALKIILEIFQTGFLTFLVFSKFSVNLEEKISDRMNGNQLKTTILFLLSLYFIRFIFVIPFDFYFNFILEHEFGFSKMSFADWVLFKLKSVSLSILAISFFGSLILFLLKKFEKTWIWIVPIVSFFVGLVMTILFPIFITPIFYKVEPIAEGSLKEKILILSKKASVNIENIYVIKESQYSSHTNAYFTGFGENKKIFLYDTLIQKHTEDEIISVLGHEIGHWIYSHQVIDMLINTASNFLLCVLVSYLFSIVKRDQSFHLKEIYSPSSLPFLVLIISLTGIFTEPVTSAISRFQETQADIVALELTHDREAFIQTEIKMAKDNQSRLNPHRFVEFYSYSHPKTMDRIKLAENFSWK